MTILLLSLLMFIAPEGVAADNQKTIAELEKSLKDELLKVWYPLAIDTTDGGFLCDFTHDWQPQGRQNKMIVTQSRHVWTTSQAAVFFNDPGYRKIAEHGFHFLRDKMWDATYGGFYMLRDRKGEAASGGYGDGKTAYGNAFAIYALAAYYAMSGDTSALHLAQKTFLWLDRHSRDPEYRGCFDRLSRDGSWLSPRTSGSAAGEVAAAGWKDQNSSIHLLEAFTELYRVWPDSLLRARIEEMLALIRDSITHQKGYLILYLHRDWTPVSFRDSSTAVREANYLYDHVSFGHDVETGYLMLEASHALGLKSDAQTLTVARRMVDHALANGWDKDNGGFYERGYYHANSDTIRIISNVKTWWVQAEGLNGLLLMANLFPEDKKYAQAFGMQWEYMKKFLIDHEHGGWYKEGLDNSPEQRTGPKGFDWKVNYHESRALMNCIKMLKSEHDLVQQHGR